MSAPLYKLTWLLRRGLEEALREARDGGLGAGPWPGWHKPGEPSTRKLSPAAQAGLDTLLGLFRPHGQLCHGTITSGHPLLVLEEPTFLHGAMSDSVVPPGHRAQAGQPLPSSAWVSPISWEEAAPGS